jgi:hypothetical protein
MAMQKEQFLHLHSYYIAAQHEAQRLISVGAKGARCYRKRPFVLSSEALFVVLHQGLDGDIKFVAAMQKG